MAIIQCKNDIELIAENILRLENWCYEILSAQELGDNFFGTLFPVVIKTERKSHHLMFKYPPLNKTLRTEGPVTEMFIREILAYTRILNEYEIIQKDFQEKNKMSVPKLIFSRDDFLNEVVVLQDMRSIGYVLSKDKLFLEVDLVRTALRSLAIMHACSFIFEKRDPKTYRNVVEILKPGQFKNFEVFTGMLRDHALKQSSIAKEILTIKALEFCAQNCYQNMSDRYYKASRAVICHGDVWRNNVLFKEGQECSACLLDFQGITLMSPAYDVLYCIMCTTTQQLRRQHYRSLLDGYYANLGYCLADVGIQVEDIFTFDDLEKDLKVVTPACLVIANMAFWQWFGLNDEDSPVGRIKLPPNYDEEKAVDMYNKTIDNIVEDLHSYKYL